MNFEKINPDLVFVLMAIKPDMDYVFEAIRELGELFYLDVQRIIDIPGDYKITDKILDFIENASIIIADLTYERPNVYFELGYARGKNKKVITTAKVGTNLHFDIKDWRCLFYTDSREIKEKLKKEFEHLFPNRLKTKSKETISQKHTSISEFLRSKSPQNDVQKTLAIGYYLEKYENMSSFNFKDLETGFRKAKEPVPSNINDKVNMNIKKGHMMEAREMKDKCKAWNLTNSGINFIEQNLGHQSKFAK